MKRRSFLQMLATVTGAATATVPVLDASSPSSSVPKERIAQAIQEIKLFRHRAGKTWPRTTAYSVPSATASARRYVRLPDTMMALPKPNIGWLLDCCRRRGGGCDELQEVIRHLWLETYIATNYQQLSDADLFAAPGVGRFATDVAVVDVKQLDERKVAWVVAEAVRSLDEAYAVAISSALVVAENQYPDEHLVTDSYWSLPEVWTSLDAGPVWSCCTYLHGRGTCLPQRVWYLNSQKDSDGQRH